jgi:hypothetical protein
MRDPEPSNIEGRKTVSHSVEHSVDWGHVSIGLGLLVLAYVLAKVFRDEDADDESDAPL